MVTTKEMKTKPKMTKEERRAKYTEIARKRRQKQLGIRFGGKKQTVCYLCRKPGHTVSNCPSKGNDSMEPQTLCYKCGSTEHALSRCPKRNSGQHDNLPFATCFLCKQKGHLISSCPQNKSGIYVNGGSCRVCGSIKHLASSCPERKRKETGTVEDKGDSSIEKLLEDQHKLPKKNSKQIGDKKRRVVKF